MHQDIIGTNAIIYTGNGALAYETQQLLADTAPIILLTDQEMPRMLGTELISAAMESEKTSPAAIAIQSAALGGKDNPEIKTCMESWNEVNFINKNDFSLIVNFIEQHCFVNPSTATVESEIDDNNIIPAERCHVSLTFG